jgi:hypothetical protein
MYDNYTWIKCKWAISCVANLFWMVKTIILNTISRDLGDTTLLYITLWTLFKISSLWCYETKSDKCKWYKRMLAVRTHSRMFGHFIWSSFEGCLIYSKIPGRQFHKWENCGQVYTCMFSSYLFVHQNIDWPQCRSPLWWISQEVRKLLFHHRYSCTLKDIKKDILNKIMSIFKVWKHSTMNYMLLKSI